MTVARLDTEMSSAEFTRWMAWYRVRDAARAGKTDQMAHELDQETTEPS